MLYYRTSSWIVVPLGLIEALSAESTGAFSQIKISRRQEIRGATQKFPRLGMV